MGTAREGAVGTAHAHYNATMIIQVIEISKLKEPNKLSLAVGHNRRTDGRDAVHIDASRSHLNVRLRGEDSFAGIKKQSDELTTQVSKPLRKDYVRWLEVVFSLPHGTGIDEAAFFRACLSWFDKYIEIPVLSADVHNDERNPHLHILAVPLFQGRMIGASFSQMDKYWPMHSAFSETVGLKYGLSMPEPKTRHSAAAKTRAVDDVIAAMKSVIKNLEPAFWDAARATMKADPEPMMRFYGINYQSAPKKKEKTFADVMIQNKPERKAIHFDKAKRIHFDSGQAEKWQSLPCVDFQNNPPIAELENDPVYDDHEDEIVRVCDDEIPAEYWDGGICHQPVTKPRKTSPAIEQTRAQIAALQAKVTV